jgi:hypothetical protein
MENKLARKKRAFLTTKNNPGIINRSPQKAINPKDQR